MPAGTSASSIERPVHRRQLLKTFRRLALASLILWGVSGVFMIIHLTGSGTFVTAFVTAVIWVTSFFLAPGLIGWSKEPSEDDEGGKPK